MKIILGLNAFHADTSACLIKDNQIIAAIEEERVNRIKHSPDFPIKAINEILKISNLDFNDITDIALNSDPRKNVSKKIFHFIKHYNYKRLFQFTKIKTNKQNRLINKLKSNYNLNKNTIFHNVEHHLSHISSTFYSSGFNEALGLTIDGSGDFSSIVISKCNKSKIEIIKRIIFPNSLGLFYQGITQFIGFNKYGDEYKLMGLAPYGDPLYFKTIKNNLFLDTENIIDLNLKYFNHHKLDFKYDISETINIGKILNNNFKDLFEKHSDIDKFKIDIASSAQKIFEYYLVKILDYLKKLNISKNIVYSGGCALNSSANNLILNDNYFENKFIHFAPADNGGSIGAALNVSNLYNIKIENIKTPFLGNKYSNEEVENILKYYKNKYDLKVKKYVSFDELCEKAVSYIIDNSVIGWFQGRMEFGPRALGNRSILADPRNHNMKNIINQKIKRRENFRPFAPSVLKEFQQDWFQENFENLYMSSVMRVKNEKLNFIPAVVHVDKTSRVQTVTEEFNLRFYKLIKKFFDKTSVPMLLNTSFNENEPIVRKPEEALDCLIRTDMDALFINDFYIKK